MSARAVSCAALLLALAVVGGCSDEAGGPKTVTAGVRISDDAGVVSAELCVRVPVLLGSVALQQRQIGSAFTVELRALRHAVEISFPGALNEAASALSIPVESLPGANPMHSISGRDGKAYTASVLTGCAVVTSLP